MQDRDYDLSNPAIGMYGTIRKTARETNGELFEVEFVIEPGDWTGPSHIHLRQEEHFEMLSGTLRLQVSGEDEFRSAGDTRMLPPQTAHTLRNDGPDDARLVLGLRPALRIEDYLRDSWRAANEGSKRRWGAPSLFELAALQRDYPDEFFYLSALPVGVQKAIFAPLAPIGRRRARRNSPGHD